MNEIQLKRIIKHHIDEYQNNIAVELESSHDKWFDDFGFPIFGETSKDYHEQVYFQSYFESYTRKMINGILKGIFDYELSYEMACPEFEYYGIYNGYTNSECEQKFGFEFVNRDEKIGYRYTTFAPEELERLLKESDVEKIKLIIWQSEEKPIGFCYDDDRVSVFSPYEWFCELFDELNPDEIDNMYQLIIDDVTKAVMQAKSMVSLVTLPGFTPSYIHKNRVTMVKDLEKEITLLSSFHVEHKDFKSTEENSKKLISKYGLPHYFLDKGLQHSLVGKSHFAKSFMTSEYLFHYFKSNPMFDYTPIVSGYIKSIEQLLHVICTSYRNSKHSWKKMSSFTLGKYTQYLKDSKDIFRQELEPNKQIVIDCLDSYRVESRNHLFHKDYFDSWDRVKLIREGTIFLYVALLGSVDMSFFNDTTLGILDDKYNTLFYLLDKNKMASYSMVLAGKEYVNLKKETRTEGISYDRHGMVKTKIKFKKLEHDDYVEIVISPDNMPSALWVIDSYGNKIKQLI